MSAATPNRINDFVIKIATVNGTGSASANGLLMKAVFRSGVPVVGKNYFPSNIQGMPTWYEIRVTRDDITVLGVPFARLCNENFQGVRTRILMKNICYAGALAALCDIDLDVIRAMLAETYAKKPKLVDSNMLAIQLGYDYARANLPCPLPLRVEKMDATRGQIIIDGNTAAAWAASTP